MTLQSKNHFTFPLCRYKFIKPDIINSDIINLLIRTNVLYCFHINQSLFFVWKRNICTIQVAFVSLSIQGLKTNEIS